jgi:hypothetical protein
MGICKTFATTSRFYESVAAEHRPGVGQFVAIPLLSRRTPPRWGSIRGYTDEVCLRRLKREAAKPHKKDAGKWLNDN